MEAKRDYVILSLKYFVVSIIVNIIIVPIHELGHALIYTLQGYKISFHFTCADPIDGTLTVLGALAGLATNILIGILFLILLSKHKNIYLYAVIAANTLYARIIPYFIAILINLIPADEKFIGDALKINPVIICIIILIAMLIIFSLATKIVFIEYGKKKATVMLLTLFLATIVSSCIMLYIEYMQYIARTATALM